jgi:hypothetical protein
VVHPIYMAWAGCGLGAPELHPNPSSFTNQNEEGLGGSRIDLADLRWGLEELASAYTPGLTVSGDMVVRRVRRLPIKGEVLVKVGDHVEPDQIVARAMLPGPLQTLKLAERLGVDPKDAPPFFQLKPGDPIEKGQVVAETKGLFGKLFKQTVIADHTGSVESISEITGNVLIREPSIPVEIRAYIPGQITDILEDEGATVETRGAMIQGIFGVGGERTGVIRVAVSDPSQPLRPSDIKDSDKGVFLVGGSGITYEAIERAVEVGASGIVAGGIKDSDLVKFLGYDIGVAITGQEQIGLTILVTEGFGFLSIADRTFNLLKSLEGLRASVNGATQIRAGVIRPEIVVAKPESDTKIEPDDEAFELKTGSPIRIIREPYFGKLGVVTDLPTTLNVLESGTEVRVLKAILSDGQDVVVPRANVEIIASG